MHAPQTLEQIDARTEHQVIGVAEDDFRSKLFQLLRRQRFDRGESADRHEDGRLDRTVRSDDLAAACGAVRLEKPKGQPRTDNRHRQPFYCSFICSSRTFDGRFSTKRLASPGRLTRMV